MSFYCLPFGFLFLLSSSANFKRYSNRLVVVTNNFNLGLSLGFNMKNIGLDAINQFLYIGDEAVHFTSKSIKLGVIRYARTAAYANGQAIRKTWREVKFEGSNHWVRIDRVVKTNRFASDPINDW